MQSDIDRAPELGDTIMMDADSLRFFAALLFR